MFVLPLGADTGGVYWGLTDAFHRWAPDWTYHSMISSRNYIEYPVDLNFDRDMLYYWWTHADVIHLSHDYHRLRRIERMRLPLRKPNVMHYHGTGFREQHEWHIREQRVMRGVGICSTLDLYLLAPEHLEWVPNSVDVEAMQNYRSEPTGSPRRHGMVKVAHAPTSRKIKSTVAFLAACERLRSEGHDLEVDLIEGVSWAECLARKSSADIYFDQTILGYGNNAIEAWGMGIPVIAGASEATKAEMVGRFGALPFYEASEGTIYDALKALVTSGDLRAELSARGLAHVQRFHDQRVVVEQLKDVYHRALQRR